MIRKTIILKVPDDIHKAVKLAAAVHNTSINWIGEEALIKFPKVRQMLKAMGR